MRYLFFMLCLMLVNKSNAQQLFTLGPHKISSEEFKRAFVKNNLGKKDESSVREYLELYVRFKLKVQAAKDLRMDTLSNLKNDIAGFRAQVAEQYMKKQAYSKQMIQEAYDRSLLEVDAAHIFIAFGEDSASAQKQIQQAYNELKKGADFGTTSRTFSSDDYVKATDGSLHYLSAFSLPYNLENILYTLKPGEYSAPVAGPKGWHIFKVNGKRPSLGYMQAAQILFAIPPNASQEEKSAIKSKADSVYKLLIKGYSFDEAVATWSNDKFTFQAQGVLPLFTYTDADPSFAKAAFSLQKDGEISAPFQTTNGWHIVKRISLKKANEKDLNDPETLQKWTDKVNADPRIAIVTQKYQEEMRRSSGYKPLAFNKTFLWALTDSVQQAENYSRIYKDHQKKALFQLQDKTISVTDWLKYIKNKQSSAGTGTLDGYDELMKEFTDVTIEQYYKDRLEKMNPDFRYQMQEFTEGSLLFEVMERTIWSKAPLDTAGLLACYQKNKDKYIWSSSVDAVIFNCADTATAGKAFRMMQQNSAPWQYYMEQLGGYAMADSGRFEFTQLPLSGDQTRFTPGQLTTIETNQSDGSSSFCYIIKVYPDKEPRDFQAAKGMVINDYQQLMEEKWIAELKKKYPVSVNEAELKKMIASF